MVNRGQLCRRYHDTEDWPADGSEFDIVQQTGVLPVSGDVDVLGETEPRYDTIVFLVGSSVGDNQLSSNQN